MNLQEQIGHIEDFIFECQQQGWYELEKEFKKLWLKINKDLYFN